MEGESRLFVADDAQEDTAYEVRGFLMLNDGENPTTIRWTTKTEGLNVEECARFGLEALLGVMIDQNAFGWANRDVEDIELSLCADFYHANHESGTDFIGVYLRTVTYMIAMDGRLVPANDEDAVGRKDLAYPRIGPAVMKMVIQPVSDGSIYAVWNRLETDRASESAHGIGMIANNANLKRMRCFPLPVGYIPPQDVGNTELPRFLVSQYAGEWAVLRGISTRGEDYLEESYIPVYPEYAPESARHFRHERIGGKSTIRWVNGPSIEPIRQPIEPS